MAGTVANMIKCRNPDECIYSDLYNNCMLVELYCEHRYTIKGDVDAET